MLDFEKVIKNTVKKGKVKFGTKQTKQAVSDGIAKLIVLSNNCLYADDIAKIAKKKNIPIYNSNSKSIDLGFTCGKTFAVSVFTVVDDGGSNILNLVKKSG